MISKVARASIILAFGFGITTTGCGAADEEAEPVATESQAVVRSLGARPLAVPDDYVATPEGYFHPSCVIHVAGDEQVDGAVGTPRLLRRDGSARAVRRCLHSRFKRDGREVTVDQAEKQAAPPPQIDGWIIAPSNASQGAVRSLSARFTVPPAPSVTSGHTLYYFPGLEPPTGNTILQPVLGWNHFGDGERWAMASWNCCVEGNVTHTDIVPVSPGDVLAGSMTGTNCNAAGVCANWRIDTLNTRNNQLVRLDTTSYNQTLEWIFGAALEVYGLTECAQLPPSNGISFTNINTATVAGGAVTFPWFFSPPSGLVPDCSYNAVASANSIQLTWSAPGQLVALPRSGWVASASSTAGADVPARALDGNLATRFSTGVPQSSPNMQWFQVDMLSQKTFRRVVLESPGSDYARNFNAYVSNDSSSWSWVGGGSTSVSGPTVINFPAATARYLQVQITREPNVGSWWSISEFNVLSEVPTQPSGQPLPRSSWVVSASATSGADVAARAIDGGATTRWSSGSAQSNAATRTFTVDMAAAQTFAKLTLESAGDYARNYQVYASNDGVNWGSAVVSGTGTGATTTITFAPRTARYVQIRQTTSPGTGSWWSIQELNIYAP